MATYAALESEIVRWSEQRRIIPNSTPHAQLLKALSESTCPKNKPLPFKLYVRMRAHMYACMRAYAYVCACVDVYRCSIYLGKYIYMYICMCSIYHGNYHAVYIYVCIPNCMGTFTHGINVCVYVCMPCIKVTMNACDVCRCVCRAMPIG